MATFDGSSARRRRERRLRMHLRHERLGVAMALAAALHHSSDGGRGTHVGPRAQTTARAGPVPAELFELYSEDGRPGGLRPPTLAEVRRQDVVKRHTGMDIEFAPPLQFLDVSVPQVEWTQQLDCLSLKDALDHVQFSVPLVEVMAVPRPAPPEKAPTELRCTNLRFPVALRVPGRAQRCFLETRSSLYGI